MFAPHFNNLEPQFLPNQVPGLDCEVSSFQNQRMNSPFLLLCIIPLTWSHSFFPTKCPAFPPQQDFDWNAFAENTWWDGIFLNISNHFDVHVFTKPRSHSDLFRFVTQKFDTSSSCLTYKFKTDNLGFKSIEQQRQLPLVGSVGLDHEYMWDAFKWTCFFLLSKKSIFSLAILT